MQPEVQVPGIRTTIVKAHARTITRTFALFAPSRDHACISQSGITAAYATRVAILRRRVGLCPMVAEAGSMDVENVRLAATATPNSDMAPVAVALSDGI